MTTKHVGFALAALLTLTSGTARAEEIDAAEIRAAVTKSLTLLETTGRTWIKKSGCVSCHHQVLPALSFALAERRGFRLDEQATRERIETTLARFTQPREDIYQGPDGIGLIGGGVLGAGYALIGLAAANVAPNATTDAMAHYIAARQLIDGHFRSPDPGRLPLEGSDVTATAVGVRALRLYAPPGLEGETAKIVQRARTWLLSVQPHGTEDKAFQLQGLAWVDADRREIAKRVAALVSEQRSDGGWAQLPDLSSDAYATGQVLVALHEAGGLPTSSAAYGKGISFLLKTQVDDGSWLVVSRARGTQPYIDSGFPYGTDQFISAAGTAWATSALLLSLDVVPVPRPR